MDRPIFIDNVLGLQHASMREILEIVKRTYCGTFALQYMHISDPEQSAWLKSGSRATARRSPSPARAARRS